MTANTMLTRASLIELQRARKTARRFNNTGLVRTLTAEISRRLGVYYTEARKAASKTGSGSLQVAYSAQAHKALTEYAALNNCTTDQAAAAIRAAN